MSSGDSCRAEEAGVVDEIMAYLVRPRTQVGEVLAAPYTTRDAFGHHWIASSPPKPKQPDSPFGTESLMVATRRVHQVQVADGSTVFVDCCGNNRIPIAAVEAIRKKAIQLELRYVINHRHATFVGQAGIVVDNKGKRCMCTARHNVANDTKKMLSRDVKAFQAAIALPGGESSGSMVSFQQEKIELANTKPMPLRTNPTRVQWRFGWDIASWPPRFSLESDPRTPLWFGEDVKREKPFELVRPDFVYEVEQKVAIVVSSVGVPKTATPENCIVPRWSLQEWVSSVTNAVAETVDQSESLEDRKKETLQSALTEIYGPGNAVTIYTGEITHVGPNHIEYDINTYKSCAGAVVFLLPTVDQGEQQPESVQPQDFGKAIAVHVGYQARLGGGSNLGLRLHRLPRTWCRSLRTVGRGFRTAFAFGSTRSAAVACRSYLGSSS